MTIVLHQPTTTSHRRSGHLEKSRSFFRDGGLFIDRNATGAIVMAWDEAQHEGHEWVPIDNAELQLWFAALPPYVSPTQRCGTVAK
jgi:hypothetical protein